MSRHHQSSPLPEGLPKPSGRKTDRHKTASILTMHRYLSMDQHDKIIVNLREVNHIMRSLYEGKESQQRILIILLETGPITQKDLTRRLGIQPGSASEVIGKLEAAGLIERAPSQTDRRTADIRLTNLGREEGQRALHRRKQRHQQMFSCLSREEKDSLLSLLEKLNTDWHARYYGENRG